MGLPYNVEKVLREV